MSQLFLVSSGTKTIQSSATVTAATNATPIAITTAAPHGLVTGDVIQLNGALGNTAANGQWVITKTGASTFTLNNSVANGAYTSGGVVTHLGWATPALLIDNTIFPRRPDLSVTFSFTFLSAGNIRAQLYDASDSAFVSEQPVWSAQYTAAQIATQDALVTGAKSQDFPGIRTGSAGDNLRAKFFIDGGPGVQATYSAWITY